MKDDTRHTNENRPAEIPAEKRDGFLDNFFGRRDAQPEPQPTDPTDAAPDGEISLEDRVRDAIRQIYDPEIPVNIYDLGLIYGIEATADGDTVVTMTLTTPHCPVAEILPGEVEMRIRAVEGVRDVEVQVVWDPPWEPSLMSEEAQLELGFI